MIRPFHARLKAHKHKVAMVCQSIHRNLARA